MEINRSGNKMKINTTRATRMGLAVVLIQLGLGAVAQGDPVRTQTLSLSEGWNAVFLEVYPSESDPAVLWAQTPIDVVAAFNTPSVAAQFLTDPGADLFRQAGWGVWYEAGRPDAFLSTLQVIYGQRAYLIHARSAFTWTVTGLVVPPETTWQPDAFNFVGFGVDGQAPPTFDQFFAGSKAHHHNRIYRLANGAWRRVVNPEQETMRSGEAFWIYCDGSSKYQGPLRVETTTRHGLLLGSDGDAVVLRNQTDHPLIPTLEHAPSGTNTVPLSIVIQMVGDPAASVRSVAAPQPDGPWEQPLPPLEAGQSVRVPLELRLQDMRAATQSSLLKISTDMGTETWIPVIGVRKDLEEN
jgi:hypothetical protein